MQFIFNNTTPSILPFLLQATQFIRQEVTLEGVQRELLLNHCKFIITEFCTNSIKHSGQPESIFNIYIDSDNLVIEKTDTGAPFYIRWKEHKLFFPLPEHIDTITLMEDDINRLRMQKLSSNSVRFYTEPNTGNSAVTYVNEHFGLIIISLSSTRFIYTWDDVTCSNIFTATIHLQA
jgi:hypothetical protein